jgi:hypothetical protein
MMYVDLPINLLNVLMHGTIGDSKSAGHFALRLSGHQSAEDLTFSGASIENSPEYAQLRDAPLRAVLGNW